MKFTFPDLPYSYDALEPYIDSATMKIHHQKHHKTYYDKFIAALEKLPADQSALREQSFPEIFAQVSKLDKAIRNHGGGLYNHTFFWESMTPKGSAMGAPLKKAIEEKWQSVEAFQEKFSDAAKNLFGSGWVWLIRDKNNALEILSTQNQDNPLMDVAEKNGTPLLGLDVWEHAYYLKHKNDRAAYVQDWWNIVNWKKVDERYSSTR